MKTEPEHVEISVDDFPEKLKEIRKKHSMTQSDLAEKLDVTQQTVSGMEKGKIEPSLKVLGAIAAILGVVIIIGAVLWKGGNDK
ncbi:MAG: helix-turn-helix transcriptional regulator [Candidatus Cohnella colombiensis]|uniref:Helix-turn-helix transcriptional regulator n=1 Tax=Candidatus Cohnella colombiensis TaxID=3121368 RepID=A0AA95JHA7_9BACL|nr:MAG: helix-turn-helix transcriptional regulator [Cohnella sp.]